MTLACPEHPVQMRCACSGDRPLFLLLAEVAPQLSKLGFEVFLLPSPEHRQVWHSAARLPDNAALHPGAHGGLDDDIIDGLLTEVRKVISSAKFGVALKVRTATCDETRLRLTFVSTDLCMHINRRFCTAKEIEKLCSTA